MRLARQLGLPATREALVLEADKQHRPGERRADLGDLAVAREQADERAPRPVVQVPGRVARAPTSRRRAPCSAPATAARGAPRRAGGARRSAPSRRACARGRGRARAPRSRWPGRTRRRRTAGSRRASPGTRGSAPGARPSPPGSTPPRGRCRRRAALAQALRPLVHEHALAAADVEQRAGLGAASKSSSSVRSKALIRRRTTGLVEPYLS